MRLILILGREYPWQSAVALVALMLSSVAEGFSLTALLPLITIVTDGQEAAGSGLPESTPGDSFDLEQKVVNVLVGLGITPTIGTLLGILVAGAIIKSLLGLVISRQIGYTMASVATNLRLSLLRALLSTRWEYFLHQRTGGLANAMSAEAMRASSTYASGIRLASLSFELVVYCTLALLVSWKATLVSIGVGVILLYVLHGLVRMSKRAGKRQTRLMKSLIARLTDSLRSVKPLKSMAREDLAGAVLAFETDRLNHALRQEVFSSAALAAAQGPIFTMTVAVAVYVAFTHWGMTLAAAFLMALALSRVLKRLGTIQRTYQQLVAYDSAYWSLQGAITEAEREREPVSGSKPPSFNRCIRLDKVRFAYRDKEVLHDISLSVPVGSFTTIVGPSGAGKTTVVDLVTGLLQPQGGSVSIDDTPLGKIDIRSWRRMIGYVPQDTVLLHDSVLANVTLGDSTLTEEDARRALRAAGAWDFVKPLRAGIYTPVGEQGASLSGGQRQRIVIARALAHKPQLLILDEATSALDVESEAAICETLRELRGDLTILAISHRPSIVDVSDRVYRLQDGIVESVTDQPIEDLPTAGAFRGADPEPQILAG